MSFAHPAVRAIRAQGPTLSVGLLSADLMALGDDIGRLERAGAAVVHVDVMDGHYVPMLTVGPPFIKAVRTSMWMDVHLMVREPLASLLDYVAAGADLVTIHPDACTHPHRVLQQLGSTASVRDPQRTVARGVALNPGTPIETLDPFLGDVEMVTVLAINPGWGGQSFLPATMDRIAAVRDRTAASGREILIAVDGGVTARNVGQLAGSGVDLVVTGSAVFSGDLAVNVRAMTAALRART
jgi:ribulose-phosphate 3-epimerase